MADPFGDKWFENNKASLDAVFNELIRDTSKEIVDDSGFQAVMSMTTSSNPSKPRTLSAGYDRSTGTMTVVFRDGTWWEYRGVPEDMWQGFNSATSKGTFMRESGLDSWADMGPSDVGSMPYHRRIQMAGLTEWATKRNTEFAQKYFVGLGRD